MNLKKEADSCLFREEKKKCENSILKTPSPSLFSYCYCWRPKPFGCGLVGLTYLCGETL